MTETTKKTTTRKRTSASASAPTSIASKRKPGPTVVEAAKSVSHDEIATLAHRFWNERGRQHGHDAEDWFRAEQALIGKAS